MKGLLKDAWALAIYTLSRIESQRLSERLALARSSRELCIDSSNSVRYAYGLVVETIRRRNLIDKFILSVIKPRNPEEMNIGVQSFLRLYVYATRVGKGWAEPDLEEASRIAKLGRAILGWKTLRVIEPFLGFLLTRQVEPIVKAATDMERVALQTFHPTWFVEYCVRLFGRSGAIAFLEGSVYPPDTFVRINTLKASEQEIIAELEMNGAKLKKAELLTHIYKVVESRLPLASLASYREGRFYLQDKGSCFAVEVADPKPGMTVLDVCAAPGAKTTHIAQLMMNQGAIYSFDYSARRMRTWKQETLRMGASIADPVIADSSNNLPINFRADAVFLDPPCTSTGSFGRQPSAKWRLTEKSAERMSDLQWQLINTCADKLKPGGFITYSTSSIMVEENEMIIERFLKWHPEFHLVEIKLPMGLPGLRGLVNCRRLYPHLHESSGIFIAKMQKDQS